MSAITMQVGSAAIPEAEKRIPSTSRPDMDSAVETVRKGADSWLRSSIGERIALLRALGEATEREAAGWVEAACLEKGIAAGSPAEGEEWLGGPVVVMRNLLLLERTLRDIESQGLPKLPKPAFVNRFGRVVAPVFPTDAYDSALFAGFSAEIWQQPKVTLDNLKEHMASGYRKRPEAGQVSLVLGAGNVSSIGPMDAFYKLFVENQTVVLKMNPINEYLGPHFERALAPLIDKGFLRIVYGGAAEGEYLCMHPGIDEIHITGSDKTHDAIVYGTGAEGAERKANRTPRNPKRITSELGNVSPIIVLPGKWSKSDIAFQAKNIVSSLTNNAGFNCNATRVVVTHRGWDQRQELLDAMQAALQECPPRKPYYPGAAQRHSAFVGTHPHAKQFGPRGEGHVPWTLITDLDPAKDDELCFTTEAWCGVTSEVALEAKSAAEYVAKAVSFANDTLWGSLSASIIVNPSSLRDASVASAVEQGIADLRYGSVAVNHWSALSYAFVSTTWGAYPGHPMHDIRSGQGVVHNTYLFDAPEKTVVRGPFKLSPKPTWFYDNATGHEVGRKLVSFYRAPAWSKVPSIVWSAIRG